MDEKERKKPPQIPKAVWYGLGGALAVVLLTIIVLETTVGGNEEQADAQPEQPESYEDAVLATLEDTIGLDTRRDGYDDRLYYPMDIYETNDGKVTGIELYLLVEPSATLNTMRLRVFQDTLDITRELFEEWPDLYEVTFDWHSPLEDEYGAETDYLIFAMEMTRDTHERINYDNVNMANLPDIADRFWEHSAVAAE